MINFACTCGQRFSLEDVQAGDSIQCHNCLLLIDVPTLDQRGSLADDGTYALAPGTDEVDPAPAPPDAQPAPRYDPENGQLIEAMPMAAYEGTTFTGGHDDAGNKIPVAKISTSTLAYARQVPIVGRAMGGHLFSPALITHVNNGITVGFVFLASILMTPALLAWWCAFALPVIMAPIILGHFSLIIESVGIQEFDTLPRFGGNVDIMDDFVRPSIRTFFSWLVTYAPSWVLVGINLRHQDDRLLKCAVGAALITGFLTPAVMITITTGSSLMNLAPNRVLGMIKKCGSPYWTMATVWTVSFVQYAGGLFLLRRAVISVFGTFDRSSALLGCAMLLLAVIGMHYACWKMGMLYRRHVQEFPWLLQRYVRTTETIDPEVLAQQAKRRAANEARSKRFTQGHSPGI